jgi:hypothetical protein
MSLWRDFYAKLVEIAPGVFEGSEPLDEAEHFYTCAICNQPVDMRQLDDVLYHDRPAHQPRPRQGGVENAR